MTSKLTRERLEKIRSWRETYGAGSNVMLPAEEAEELARIALAAMDSEPVAYTDERNLCYIDRGRETAYLWGKQNSEASDVALYRHAQPAPVLLDGLIKAVEFYEQVKRENPPVETGAWKDAVDWVLKEACRAAMLQAGNSPVIPEGWQVEAERLAEMHGMSFVLFRHGEAPQCADPTKVVISFTDKGLGHDTLPAAPQELK